MVDVATPAPDDFSKNVRMKFSAASIKAGIQKPPAPVEAWLAYFSAGDYWIVRLRPSQTMRISTAQRLGAKRPEWEKEHDGDCARFCDLP
jgi:hypothetical protein